MVGEMANGSHLPAQAGVERGSYNRLKRTLVGMACQAVRLVWLLFSSMLTNGPWSRPPRVTATYCHAPDAWARRPHLEILRLGVLAPLR